MLIHFFISISNFCTLLQPTRTRLYQFGSILLGALLLCFMGLYNGYPLFYYDSGTYIDTGIEHYLSEFRTFSYGIFVAWSSLKVSLWLTIFKQSVIVSLLIFYCVRFFTKGNINILIPYFISIIIITFTTGVSIFSSQIMADIFTPITLLCFILLYQDKNLNIRDSTIIGFIFMFSITTHNSHFPTIGSALLCIILIRLLRVLLFKKGTYKTVIIGSPIKYIISLIFIAYIGISAVNMKLSKSINIKNFSPNRGGHLFLVNRLLETNIIHNFLQENCNKYPYKLCPYKDSLPQPGFFLWDDATTPLHKIGGWKGTQQDFNKMLYEIFTTPKYIKAYLKDLYRSTISQLQHFELGDNLGFNIFVKKSIHKHYPREESTFFKSKNYQNTLNVSFLNTLQNISLAFFMISFIVLLVLKRVNKEIQYFSVLLIIFLICNAVICSGTSGVGDRYEARIIWLLILPGLFTLYNNILSLFSLKNTNSTRNEKA